MTKKPNSRENPQILLSEHYSLPWKSALDNSTKVLLLLIVLLGLLPLTQHPFQTLEFSDNVYALRVLTPLDLMIAHHVGTLTLCNQSKTSRFSRSPRHSWLPLPTSLLPGYSPCRFSPWRAQCSEKCLMKPLPLHLTEQARINILSSHIQIITVI